MLKLLSLPRSSLLTPLLSVVARWNARARADDLRTPEDATMQDFIAVQIRQNPVMNGFIGGIHDE